MNNDPTGPTDEDDADDQPATVEQLAAASFEPWTHEPDEFTPPSNREWNEIGTRDLPFVRLAWAAMFKTKNELITIIEADPELITRLANDFVGVEKTLRQISEMAELMAGAYVRILSATATACLQERG